MKRLIPILALFATTMLDSFAAAQKFVTGTEVLSATNAIARPPPGTTTSTITAVNSTAAPSAANTLGILSFEVSASSPLQSQLIIKGNSGDTISTFGLWSMDKLLLGNDLQVSGVIKDAGITSPANGILGVDSTGEFSEYKVFSADQFGHAAGALGIKDGVSLTNAVLKETTTFSSTTYATIDYDKGVVFSGSGGNSATNNITNTVHNGHVRFNANVVDSTGNAGTQGQYWGHNGTLAKYISPRNFIDIVEHHVGQQPVNASAGVGEFGFTGLTTVAGAYTTAAGTAGHPGLWQLGTATATNGCVSYMPAGSVKTPILFGGGVYKLTMIFRLPIVSTDADTFAIWGGFGDVSASGTMTDGAFFTYSNNAIFGITNANVIEFQTASNTVRTATSSGVTVVAGTFHVVTIEINAAGTSATFTADGGSPVVIGTNVPTGTGRETSIIWKIEKGAGSTGITARNLDIDLTWLTVNLTTGL